MKTERFDIHQHITDQIIAAIERGAGEFRLPWHRSAGNIMRPVNVSSKKPHRGVNILTLWATADEKGYTRPALGAPTSNGRKPARSPQGREGRLYRLLQGNHRRLGRARQRRSRNSSVSSPWSRRRIASAYLVDRASRSRRVTISRSPLSSSASARRNPARSDRGQLCTSFMHKKRGFETRAWVLCKN
jgi:hypothetical protein